MEKGITENSVTLDEAAKTMGETMAGMADSFRNIAESAKSGARALGHFIWLLRGRPKRRLSPMSRNQIKRAITHLPNTLDFLQ